MDINDIYSGISNVGFPIAISLYLIYSGNKRDEKFSEAIESLRRTVENNTNILSRLYDRLSGKE